MKKFLNSLVFYIIAASGVIFTLNDEFNIFNIVGILILMFIFISMKYSTKEENYEILGITWLQKKFNSNPIIADLTTEE